MKQSLRPETNAARASANQRRERSVSTYCYQCVAGPDLLKVRISTDDREECDRVAEELAARLPCQLVQRVGRVALLFRPAAEGNQQ